MKYYCNVCDKKFKKFIIFEGHFDFNEKCRAKHSAFLQCYICLQEFRHLATLKYHLRQHNFSNIQHQSKFVNKIPKITLKKQWNFKVFSPVQENKNGKENESIHNIKCRICKKSFRSIIYLEQHLLIHSKKRLTRNKRINKNARSKLISISRVRNKKIRLKTIHSIVKRKRTTSQNFQCKICRMYTSSSPRLGKIDCLFSKLLPIN